MVTFAGFVIGRLTAPKPRPAPVKPVQAVDTVYVTDTLWLGVTYVECLDGTVVVKYKRLKNPVLWDAKGGK
jgi:hypothetical protein